MKKSMASILAILSLAIIFFACKKDTGNAVVPDSGKLFEYRGVIVGPSGYFRFGLCP